QPQAVAETYGAELFRRCAASVGDRGDGRTSDTLLTQPAAVYRRIRSTARLSSGNTAAADTQHEPRPLAQMTAPVRWAVLRLRRLARRAIKAYRDYEYHVVFHQVHHFCAVDMGGFYLDALKDRLYCEGPASLERRSAQTALFDILVTLTKLIAPVLAYTADEIWQHLPEAAREQESVHLTTWAEPPVETPEEQALVDKWERLLAV